MNKNLAIAVVGLAAWKFVLCSAATAIAFEEFKPLSINGASGKFAGTNGVFQLSNSTETNGLYFVAQRFSGNGQFSARIRRPTPSSAKIGVTFRQDTKASSPFAGMFSTGSNVVFERLANPKEPAATTIQTNESAAWLRVVREGNAFSGFFSRDGTNWVQLSADTLEMPDEILVGMAVVGAGEASVDQVRMTRAELLRPPDKASFVMPTNVLLEADIASIGGKVSKVEFFSGTELIREIVNSPYAFLWTNVLGGSHSVTAKVTDELGAEFFSEPVEYEINLPAASATLLGVDEKTKGNWKGVFGERGFLIVNDKTNFPSGIKLTPENALPFTWPDTPDTEQRALLRAGPSGRILSSWNHRHPIILNLSLADGSQQRFTLYFLDCDKKGRTMDVQIWNGSGKLLDRQAVGSFIEGKYLTWLLRGKVIIRIASIGPSNPIVSALFFDPAQ